MDFETSKKYYNLCDPYEWLEPEDERNVEIDALEGSPVRGINWVSRLTKEFARSEKPVFKLFTGHIGSGKTTELRRLCKRLSDPDGLNLFPVYINADRVLDLSNPIDVTDILSAVMYYTEKAIVEQEGGSSEKALEEGYFRRFWNWLTETEVSLGKGEFAVPNVGKLSFEMQARPSLRQRVRETVASHFLKFITEIKSELEMRNFHVQNKYKKKGIVIIFDSIEHLKGLTSNWQQVTESAEKVFGSGAHHLRLPVHVLYTVPPALATRIPGIDFLPMIKVFDRENRPWDQGIGTARELIRKRLPDEIVQEIFDTDAEDRIKRLILQSGGYPREIVQMVRMCMLEDTYPLSERAVERIIKSMDNQYRMVVTGEMFHWLASVSKKKYLVIQDDDHRKIAARALDNHLVLLYLNDEFWYDLHPSVYQIPEIRQIINESGQESDGIGG